MLSNYMTETKGRVDSNKDISVKERDELVDIALARLGEGYEL